MDDIDIDLDELAEVAHGVLGVSVISDRIKAKFARLRAEVEQLRGVIEKSLRLMSGDPDGEINWSRVGEVMESYAAAFDPHGLTQENDRLRARVAELEQYNANLRQSLEQKEGGF